MGIDYLTVVGIKLSKEVFKKMCFVKITDEQYRIRNFIGHQKQGTCEELIDFLLYDEQMINNYYIHESDSDDNIYICSSSIDPLQNETKTIEIENLIKLQNFVENKTQKKLPLEITTISW